MQVSRCRVLISGAGPSGLVAALMCLDRAWTDIVVVERRADPSQFERGKAFNYQLDGRGQAILERLGIGADHLRRYGLPNDHFKLTQFTPEGKANTSSPPILMPDRKTPYWMTRHNLLKMLQEVLAERNKTGAVSMLYGHEVERLACDDEGFLQAHITTAQNCQAVFSAELILGCDGLGSQVRKGLKSLGTEPGFEMKSFPSPSAGLKYKVLALPPKFSVAGHASGVTDHEMAYAFHSNYAEKKKRLALFALPVPSPTENRNVNIILPSDHHFWGLTGVDEIMGFLHQGFPQLAFDSLVSSEEAQAFANGPPGAFPRPQYAQQIHALFSKGARKTDCLLIGDAAHAFPPDLGMGVNSALEDLLVLNKLLDKHQDNVPAACNEYQVSRLPENRALVHLVKSVHPYQYNQVPWRLKLWMVKFVVQLAISKVTGGRVSPPGFVLSQHHLMSFVEMKRRKNQADTVFFGLLALLAAGVGVGVTALL